MIYLDSDMSKSTNTVVYFDWKMVIYIYICGKCRTQFMLPMEKSITFTDACANEIIPSINRSFVYKAKEGCHVRICNIKCRLSKLFFRFIPKKFLHLYFFYYYIFNIAQLTPNYFYIYIKSPRNLYLI